MIAHWDDLEPSHEAEGTIEFEGYDLGEAAGTRDVGVTRAQVRPGKQSSPVHVEVAEEEIFFVLDGSGLSWQDGETFEVRARRLHRPSRRRGGAHPDRRARRARRARVRRALDAGDHVAAATSRRAYRHLARSADDRPWALEAAQGELELPAPSPRRANIVNLDDVEADSGWRNLGRAAGSVRTGLKHVTVPAGQLHCPPHCHAAEEEIFVVLAGDGVLELTPVPDAVDEGATAEQHEVRAGHIVSRLPGSGMAHAFRGGEDGMTLLAYGQKIRNEILYYPRSNKIYFRGVGVMARLDHLAYEVGEESTV